LLFVVPYPQRLLCGVPQRSVLGPVLFALYSADVIQIAAAHGVAIDAYADYRLTSAALLLTSTLPPTAFWHVPLTLTSG